MREQDKGALLFVVGLFVMVFAILVLPIHLTNERERRDDSNLESYCNEQGGRLLVAEDLCVIGSDVIRQDRNGTFVIIIPQ